MLIKQRISSNTFQYRSMGFWSWVCNTARSVTRAVSSVVSTVSSAVSSVVRTVSSAVSSVVRTVSSAVSSVVSTVSKVASSAWNGVKKGFDYVANKVRQVGEWVSDTPLVRGIRKGWEATTNAVSKAVDWVKKGYNYVTEKVNQATQWLSNTTLGKALTRAKNYIMDKTPLGTAIKWGREKLSQASDYFFEQTWVGKTLVKGIQMWNNSAVGKFVNKYVVPVVKVGSMLVGGLGLAGGIVGKCFTVAGNVVSHYENIRNLPSYAKGLLLDNPITKKVTEYASIAYSSVANKILDSPVAKKLTGWAERGDAFISSVKQKVYDRVQPIVDRGKALYRQTLRNPYVNKVVETTSYIKQKVSPYIEQGSNKLKEIIRRYSPSVVYQGAQLANTVYDKAKEVGSRVQGAAASYLKPYTDKVNNSVPGRAINACTRFTGKYPLPAAKWVASKIIVPPINYVSNKITERLKKTSIYDAYLKGRDSQNMATMSDKFKPLLAHQNKQNGLSSDTFLGRLGQKHGVSEKSMTKIRQKFEEVSGSSPASPSNDAPVLLNRMLQTGQAKINSVVFDKIPDVEVESKQSTIAGKMLLENTTEEDINFMIEPGQVFGCQNFRTSQHTVVKGMNGCLPAKETKQFILDAFCGDLQLRWPYEDPNYTLTSLKMKGFHHQMNQLEVWKTTG